MQLDLWKRYITFEKSNPLRSEDTALVTRRVMFATEQCLLVLTHHPAVWHQAAQYLDQSAKLLNEKGVRSSFHSFTTHLRPPAWLGRAVQDDDDQTGWLLVLWFLVIPFCGIKPIQVDGGRGRCKWNILHRVVVLFNVLCWMELADGRARCLAIGMF